MKFESLSWFKNCICVRDLITIYDARNLLLKIIKYGIRYLCYNEDMYDPILNLFFYFGRLNMLLIIDWLVEFALSIFGEPVIYSVRSYLVTINYYRLFYLIIGMLISSFFICRFWTIVSNSCEPDLRRLKNEAFRGTPVNCIFSWIWLTLRSN